MIPGATFILLSVALVVPVFFVVMWVAGGYHRLGALRTRCKSAYARLDEQLKHRYDLILGLIETAKSYLTDERGSIEAVAAARNAASSANLRAAQAPGDVAAMKELSRAEMALAGTLGRLFAAAETCPELVANPTMVDRLAELTLTENKTTIARQDYNDAVMSYNTIRETFPTSLLAITFSFDPAESFLIDKPEAEAKGLLSRSSAT
jgi:LemA protein